LIKNVKRWEKCTAAKEKQLQRKNSAATEKETTQPRMDRTWHLPLFLDAHNKGIWFRVSFSAE